MSIHGRAPNIAIIEEYSYRHVYNEDPIVLPAGSFVKPIESKYMPPHILEKFKHSFNPETEILCYTKKGIIPIPKNILTER